MDYSTLIESEYRAMSELDFASLPEDERDGGGTPVVAEVVNDIGIVMPENVLASDRRLRFKVTGVEDGEIFRLVLNGEDDVLGEAHNGYVVFAPYSSQLQTVRHEVQIKRLDGLPSEALDLTFKPSWQVVGHPEPPVIHPDEGTYFEYPVTVSITSSVPGGQILYMVDGTGFAQPTIEYKGPFRVSQTSVIKARVVFQGWMKSEVVRTKITVVR